MAAATADLGGALCVALSARAQEKGFGGVYYQGTHHQGSGRRGVYYQDARGDSQRVVRRCLLRVGVMSRPRDDAPVLPAGVPVLISDDEHGALQVKRGGSDPCSGTFWQSISGHSGEGLALH